MPSQAFRSLCVLARWRVVLPSCPDNVTSASFFVWRMCVWTRFSSALASYIIGVFFHSTRNFILIVKVFTSLWILWHLLVNVGEFVDTPWLALISTRIVPVAGTRRRGLTPVLKEISVLHAIFLLRNENCA